MTVNDIILAVKQFKSQATGEDGIPQSSLQRPFPSLLRILPNYLIHPFTTAPSHNPGRNHESWHLEKWPLLRHHQIFIPYLCYVSCQRYLKNLPMIKYWTSLMLPRFLIDYNWLLKISQHSIGFVEAHWWYSIGYGQKTGYYTVAVRFQQGFWHNFPY